MAAPCCACRLAPRPTASGLADLVELIGTAATTKLIAVYGGEKIWIPRCAQALRDIRDRRIIAAYDGGQSASRLAREHSLTDRQIYTILKRCPGQPVGGMGSGQGALF
jgi:Mor family transcriptional regulator